MTDSKSALSGMSGEKRDPGFVKLRRGLLPHLGRMSSNATKLYVWLLLSADWRKGPMRGSVVASFADIGRDLRVSSKTLQRAVEELETREKPFISVERAANQYELTQIRIFRYDSCDDTSGVDKSDHSNSIGMDTAVDTAVDSGVDKSDHSDVHSNRSNSLKSKDLRAPKKLEEVKNIKREAMDAVRRRFDAELHPSDDDLVSKVKPKTSFETKPNLSEPGKAKLQSRIADKIAKSKESYAEHITSELSEGRPHPFGDGKKRAFAELGYHINIRSADVSWDFVFTACDVCDDNRGKGISPGNLCSKVIDAISTKRESDLRDGGDGGGYYWPPDFQKHRDALRARERLAEEAARAQTTTSKTFTREEAQRLVDRKEATWVDDRKEHIRLIPNGAEPKARANLGGTACAR